MQLRDQFIEAFDLVNKNCTIDAGDPGPGVPMCVFDVDWQPAGPFVAAQLSFFIPKIDLQRTQHWIMKHRGIYDVMIHPNSGCET